MPTMTTDVLDVVNGDVLPSVPALTRQQLDDMSRMLYVFGGDDLEIRHRTHEVFRTRFPHGWGLSAEKRSFYELGYTGKQKFLSVDALMSAVTGITPRQSCIRRLHALDIWNIHTVTGDDIHEVFENYRPGSCMSGKECRFMREVYCCNPKVIGAIYLVREENPALGISSCSALYWVGRKNVYLDRTYQTGCQSLPLLRSLMLRHLVQKTGLTGCALHTETADLSVYDKPVRFRLKRPSTDILPYIDSLEKLADVDDTHIVLSSVKGSTCKSTSGTIIGSGVSCECPNCGMRMRRNGHPDGWCGYCDDVDDVEDVDDDDDVEAIEEDEPDTTDDHGEWSFPQTGRYSERQVSLNNPLFAQHILRAGVDSIFVTNAWQTVGMSAGCSVVGRGVLARCSLMRHPLVTYSHDGRDYSDYILIDPVEHPEHRCRPGIDQCLGGHNLYGDMSTIYWEEIMGLAGVRLGGVACRTYLVRCSRHEHPNYQPATTTTNTQAPAETQADQRVWPDTVPPIVGQYVRLRNGEWHGPVISRPSTNYPFGIRLGATWASNGQYYVGSREPYVLDIVQTAEQLPDGTTLTAGPPGT